MAMLRKRTPSSSARWKCRGCAALIPQRARRGSARTVLVCPKQLWVSKARMTQQEGFKCYQIYGLACDDDVEEESADDDDEVEDAPQEDNEFFELFGEE